MGLAAALLLVGVAGCGYRSQLGPSGPVGEGAANPNEARLRIAVIALRNDSTEPWLDRIVGDAMRRELVARGRFQLVDSPAQAEWILRGRVRPLDIRSRSFSTFAAALEYSVRLELDLELERVGRQRIRLDSRMLTDSDIYLASADIEVTRSNRLEALRRLSDLVASRVADSLELMERPIEDKRG